MQSNGQAQAQPTPTNPEWLASQLQYRDAGTWPEGVIARYLTTTGALVELTDGEHSIKGTCSGCPEPAQPLPFSYDPTCSGYRMDSYVQRDATTWAQKHAEKCRALPRPVQA